MQGLYSSFIQTNYTIVIPYLIQTTSACWFKKSRIFMKGFRVWTNLKLKINIFNDFDLGNGEVYYVYEFPKSSWANLRFARRIGTVSKSPKFQQFRWFFTHLRNALNFRQKTNFARKFLRILPRKEVIQPHLPVRLPCYDFTPVTNPALGRCLRMVSSRTSGVVDSHGVTGGVYKTRERIQRSVLICVY